MFRLPIAALIFIALAGGASAQSTEPADEQAPAVSQEPITSAPVPEPAKSQEQPATSPSTEAPVLAAPMPQPLAAPVMEVQPETVQPKAAGELMVVPAPSGDLPGWATAVVLLLGAFLAGMFGVVSAVMMRRAEIRHRRSAAAACLAVEIETRRQAFEAVPLPPNVEAGVFFVSAVTSLAGTDAGFRAAQTDLNLLPAKMAAHVSVHYAAVQRVADFVKGQSLAAAVRMMQANRLGGHPCPDAGTMRDAYEELTAAFRGTDKLASNLKQLV